MSYDFIQVRFKMDCLVSICSKRKYSQRVIPVCECFSYQNGKKMKGQKGHQVQWVHVRLNIKIVAKSNFL